MEQTSRVSSNVSGPTVDGCESRNEVTEGRRQRRVAAVAGEIKKRAKIKARVLGKIQHLCVHVRQSILGYVDEREVVRVKPVVGVIHKPAHLCIHPLLFSGTRREDRAVWPDAHYTC